MPALLLVLALQSAAELRELDPKVDPQPRALETALRDGLRRANEADLALWKTIRTREDWERVRDDRVAALRRSLGAWPAPPRDLKPKVVRTIQGVGYRIENLVFESRPGLLVTANLYQPDPFRSFAPCILVAHSHHAAKTHGELQDLGAVWARAGCRVLVMDLLGHGERRQHAFADAAGWPEKFRPERQDYWFRYNTNAQLSLLGESLIGWMAWDLMRGADLLRSQPGADATRVLLLGAVAGGGDPAAVAAALDPRIEGVVPFNFGGPQPESRYPLPDDAETSFGYAGGGSWESTRNLAFSARDGFLPWSIVASVAPRVLVHAHEFSWDRERDPVWKRYVRIWGFYGKADRLFSAQGRGVLSGAPPEATHCTHIGAEHRRNGIDQAFEKAFAIRVADESRDRRPVADLRCDVPLKPLHELLAAEAPRAQGGRDALAAAWSRILGGVAPAEGAVEERLPGRFVLLDGGIPVPLLFLAPPGEGRRPVVVAVAQGGKAGFLKERADNLAELLAGGVAVCLADLAGTGETAPGSGVGRTSALTSLSSTALMLGRPLAGIRVRQLRGVLAWLRARGDVDPARLALWGDSFAPPNGPGVRTDAPYGAPSAPREAHPMGATTALLTALFEPGLKAVRARGGLTSFASALESPYLWLPHDAFVPGALAAGDLPRIAEAVRARVEDAVDARNRAAGPDPKSARWLLEVLR